MRYFRFKKRHLIGLQHNLTMILFPKPTNNITFAPQMILMVKVYG
jgi:hypothetical protein